MLLYVISLLQVEKILCALLAMFVRASPCTNNYSFSFSFLNNSSFSFATWKRFAFASQGTDSYIFLACVYSFWRNVSLSLSL